MGRSKFPGKPPKTATRKRIKVLGQPEAAQNDPVTVAENIYYGLSLFNETFGDNEKVRGKKDRRVESSAVAVRLRRRRRFRRRRHRTVIVHRCRRYRSRYHVAVARGRGRSSSVASRVAPRLAARAYSPASVTRTRTRWTWRYAARRRTLARRSARVNLSAVINRGDCRTAGARRVRGLYLPFSDSFLNLPLPPLPYVDRVIEISIHFVLAAFGTEYVSEICLLQFLLRNFLSAGKNVGLSVFFFVNKTLQKAGCRVDKVNLLVICLLSWFDK